jgi:hypothetical protein
MFEFFKVRILLMFFLSICDVWIFCDVKGFRQQEAREKQCHGSSCCHPEHTSRFCRPCLTKCFRISCRHWREKTNRIMKDTETDSEAGRQSETSVVVLVCSQKLNVTDSLTVPPRSNHHWHYTHQILETTLTDHTSPTSSPHCNSSCVQIKMKISMHPGVIRLLLLLTIT